jgi:hypothetical protein
MVPNSNHFTCSLLSTQEIKQNIAHSQTILCVVDVTFFCGRTVIASQGA